jgi:hypothetical protein
MPTPAIPIPVQTADCQSYHLYILSVIIDTSFFKKKKIKKFMLGNLTFSKNSQRGHIYKISHLFYCVKSYICYLNKLESMFEK